MLVGWPRPRWQTAPELFQRLRLQLATRLTGQDNRILMLEQSMKHLPDSEQLTELAGELADLAGDMKAIKVELAGVAKALDPLTRSVDRINDYLLNNARP